MMMPGARTGSPRRGGHMKPRMLSVLFLLALVASAGMAHAQAAFTVAGVTAQPGTIASGEVQVPARGTDPGTVIPFSILNGAKSGPVLTLVAGTHGAEYPPILALQRLRSSIDPKGLSGTIVMIHAANMPAFLGRAIYYTPGDHQNLNRVFPGKADGTISERIAFAITREFIERTQYLIDLHCGDANESLRPYLYWTINASPPLVESIRQMAAAFGMDHVILDNGRPTDPAASVYLENTAITRGKPALTIESGGMGLSDEESIARIERGVAGVLKHLKMRATGPDPIEHIVFLGRNQVLTSQHTGIFYALVDKGTTVAEGALIGRVTDFHGKTLEEVRAPFAGEILYVIGTPPTSKGEPLGFIAAPAKLDEMPKK
jgi:predicted deacylase